nr:protein EFFECTOR OF TRANSCRIPTION 2 [Ipomoea batatas]
MKREDCKRTKHDSVFSEWKILVGPSDWQDYMLGNDGAERYRTQNLPNCASCPGIYELGIAVSNPRSRLDTNKIDTAKIVPVYVGQADNVRTRLQQYGRDGSHLENGCSKSEFSWDKNGCCQKGLAFFTSAFSRGFSIVYRWAPMKSKKDAEKAEAQLLGKFDYAWNTDSNGARRHNDVFCKLERISRASLLPAIIRRFKLKLQKPRGVKIEVCEPLPLENGSYFYGNTKRTHSLPQIFKFGRSQPRVVSVNFGVNESPGTICGVALGHGSVCIRSPVEGNKRFFEHRGMKVNGLTSKLIAEGNSHLPAESLSGISSYLDDTLICGFILEDGSSCMSKPFGKNKRCIEHKGRRVPGSHLKLLTNHKEHNMCSPIAESQNVFSWSDTDLDQEGNMKEGWNESRTEQDDSRSAIHRDCTIICGVNIHDGNFCTRQPSAGRKRCEEHKGMSIKNPNTQHLNLNPPKTSDERSNSIATCGVTLSNGSSCRRKLAEGNKQCWQHRSIS